MGPSLMRVCAIDSENLSWISAFAGLVRYCSITCTNASITPLRVWRAGRVNVKVGSSTENCGKTFSEAKESFLHISLRLTTAFMFISEPVAGSVKTVPKGRASFTGKSFSRMSHGSFPL